MKKIIALAVCTAFLKISMAQVPALSSLPSASAVIFLDFDGHTVDGTSWNYDGPIFCAASGLNATQVTDVFNRVAEDYRPFNVNVTTDSAYYMAAPASTRIRAVVTTSSAWYGVAAGGVSFVGSFTWGDDSPCFVFSQLLNYNVKNISEACSHEVGHSLGLYHQASYDGNCVKTSDYNYGTGTGQTGWAPIMGVGYYQNMTVWNNGPNPYGCTNYQSDLTIITTQNGFGFRTDDFPETFAGASQQHFIAGQFSVTGIIERNTDKDMFRFTMPAPGRFRLTALPGSAGTANTGANIDLQLTIYNNAQAVIGTYNPSTLMDATIDTNLLAGNYFIRVEGRGNTYAPDYASLGKYSLQATLSNTVLALHKLLLRGTVQGDIHRLSWELEADEAVTRQVLEVSANGSSFTPATVSLFPGDRGWQGVQYASHAVYYRLQVELASGKRYYSNTILLTSAGKHGDLYLLSAIVSNTAVLIGSGNERFEIFNSNGACVYRGTTVSGATSINTGSWAAGIYYIRAVSNEIPVQLKLLKN